MRVSGGDKISDAHETIRRASDWFVRHLEVPLVVQFQLDGERAFHF